jgi:hypothetical protein
MELIAKVVPQSFNLFLFGDCHIGSIAFSEKRFNKFMKMMGKEYAGCGVNLAVDHGDSVEGMTVDDKRYDPRNMRDPRGTPFDEANTYIKLVMPIKERIICKLMGNHEWYLNKFGDMTKYMCKELEVPYGTYSAKITYVGDNGKVLFKHYAVHGRKSVTSTADDPIRRDANMELILKRHMKDKAGDCLLMSKGHTHKLIVCPPREKLYLVDDGKKIVQKYTHAGQAEGYIHPDHRWYVNTGSFLRTFVIGGSTYSERAEYDPVELGFAVVMVRNGEIVGVRKIVLGD